jgi:membrane peptidoglycan carboxypeptidase
LRSPAIQRSIHQERVARIAGLLATRERRAARRGISVRRVVTVLLTIAVSTTLAVTAALFAGAIFAWNYFSEDLPALDSVEASQFQTTRIYDRNGVLLYEVNDPLTGFRTYSPLDEITGAGENTYLLEATVAAEDRTFWDNIGIDPVAIARGVIINLTGNGSSGASTITQQLARQLYPETIGYERNYFRKMREAIVAMQLTDAYPKETIMEMYLNSVYYGNRAYGIDAAARSYFDKDPAQLSLAEAALLAGLPQAPSAYDPTVNMAAAKLRQRYVLDQMVEAGYINGEEADQAWQEIIVVYPTANRLILAPHWVNFVVGELEAQYGAELVYRGGLSVRTSLDYDLQLEAERIVSQHLERIAPYQANNGALVAMTPGTGEILAMVGSNDYWDDAIAGQFNVAASERQPGSAFMPIVYASAFEKGWNPGTVILDYRSRYQTPGAPNPEYVPENTTHLHYGAVTARSALSRSLNVPAVKALEYVGIEPTIDLAHRMGVRTGLWRGLGFYGLALALGAGEVSPLELTNAYATLANNGRYVNYQPVLEITNSSGEVLFQLDRDSGLDNAAQTLSAESAYLVTNVLADKEARLPAFGASSPLDFPELNGRQVAVKSGTSFDWLDNWTVGYTTDLVVGVWVGNASNAPLLQLDGVAGAAPIFHEFMVTAYEPEYAGLVQDAPTISEDDEFVRPAGIQELQLCVATGGLPIGRAETHVEIVDSRRRPALRCDQLTTTQFNELQAALQEVSLGQAEFAPGAVDSILSYSLMVGGGIGVPDDPIEPTPTPSPTPTPTPIPTQPPTPTPRPTSTPVPSPPPAQSTPTPGDDEDRVSVPNLFGAEEGAAQAIIEEAGLSVAGVVYITQSDLPPGVDISIVEIGEVFFQSPAPGTLVADGAGVTIAVRAE